MTNPTLSTLVDQLKTNPLNWALFAVFLYVLRSYLSASAPTVPEPKHPETIVFRDYTPIELQVYTGRQDNDRGRILMAVNGNVYDVTRGRNFYGQGANCLYFICYRPFLFLNPTSWTNIYNPPP